MKPLFMRKKDWRALLCAAVSVLLLGGRATAQFEAGFPTPQIGVINCGVMPYQPSVLTYTAQTGENAPFIRNILRFKLNELATTSGSGTPLQYFPSAFTATATMSVQVWNYNVNGNYTGAATATLPETLTINYDPAAGVKYTPVSYLILSSAQQYGQVSVTLSNVTVSGLSGSWTSANVRPLLAVENEMQALHYFTLSGNAASLTPTFDSVYDPMNHPDQLSVSWGFPDTAYNNFSQLEYAWVENETQGYYSVGGAFSTNLLFETNSTRIDIDDSICNYPKNFSYNIPLLFDADSATGGGIMYYRVRAVERNNDGSMITGPWSEPRAFKNSGHPHDMN